MSEAKIEVSFGSLSFAGQGEQDWLAEQLDKILDTASKLQVSEVPPIDPNAAAGNSPGEAGEFTETLASYIKAKGGDSNQVLRFLATADWLRRRGADKLTTSVVSKALSSNHQKKLGNPADCLNKNVSKGHCEKQGDGFYITPDGLKILGYS